MTQIKKNRSMWLPITLIGLLVLMAAGTSGCSPFTKGKDMPERAQVVAAAKSVGFDFDHTLVSTAYGSSPSEIILTGPIVQVLGADGPGDRVKKVEWTQLVMELKDGKWTFVSGTKRAVRTW